MGRAITDGENQEMVASRGVADCYLVRQRPAAGGGRRAVQAADDFSGLARLKRRDEERKTTRVAAGGVGSEGIFHTQHSQRIAVTLIANLLGDVAPQLQARVDLAFNADFQFANVT